MLKAILFDLDDTLLDCSMDVFFPRYIEALTRYASAVIPPERFTRELMRATSAMDANDGTGPTNQETFDAAFYPALGYEPDELWPLFEKFYSEEFSKLRSLTRRRPEARPLMEWAFDQGLQVVIATNPFFPPSPVEQRLQWAGIPVTDFGYDLVTTYDLMHATKAHPAYYREILAKLGRDAGECLMVGDHWPWDIAMPSSVGISVYWIADKSDVPPSGNVPLVGKGTLNGFWAWAQADGLEIV